MAEVKKLVQAVCDDCGWHSSLIESTGGGTSIVMQWVRIHEQECKGSKVKAPNG